MLTVTLTITNGTLTLSGTAGLVFTTGTGAGDTTMTFSGTIANINASLDGLVFAPTTNYNGAATLTVDTSDGANSDLDTVAISVLGVNDAPVVTASGGALVYTENDPASAVDAVWP